MDKLKDNKSGKVLEFDWGVGQWRDLVLSSDADHPFDLDNPATFEPREVGTHEACTGQFACQCHDDVFNPKLDTDNPDFTDLYVRKLAVGRAVLYAADLASKRKFLVDKWHSLSIRSTNRGLRMQWAKKREFAYQAHGMAHSTVERWRNTWRSADKAGEKPEGFVDWSPLTFRSTLTFAACIFYGQATVAMVLPRDGGHHEMTVLYYGWDVERAKEDKEQLAKRAKDTAEADSYGVSMINELMSKGSGAIAASPASYKRLGDQDRLAIQRIIMESLNSSGISQSLRGEAAPVPD